MAHAVVIGAGPAGLLAAAALSDTYDTVTVLDRDTIPDRPSHRRGTAQSHHAHGLPARGVAAIDELLPGLTAELAAHGALACDMQKDIRWIAEGRPLARGSGRMPSLLVGRPLLEDRIRARVDGLPNVMLIGGRAVTGLLSHGDVITGVRLGGAVVLADLVVDASGRNSQTPVWLGELGLTPPREERVALDAGYASRLFHRRPDHLGGDLGLVVGPAPGHPRTGIAIAIEDDRWLVTLGAYREEPPADRDGFVTWSKSLAVPDLHDLLGDAEPIGDVHVHTMPFGLRRAYERLRRFPEGLLVLGDAVCATNPWYAQGMTVAALEALALRGWARDGYTRPRMFFRSIARIVGPAWRNAVDGDAGFAPGGRTAGGLTGAYRRRMVRAAQTDAEVARRMLRVSHMLDSPAALRRPATIRRVLTVA